MFSHPPIHLLNSNSSTLNKWVFGDRVFEDMTKSKWCFAISCKGLLAGLVYFQGIDGQSILFINPRFHLHLKLDIQPLGWSSDSYVL